MAIDPDDLEAVDIPLDEFNLLVEAQAPKAITVREAKDLRPHNKAAVDAIEAFEGDRGQVIRATGTGKTVVQGATIARLGAEKVLVLVPSIDLALQNGLSFLQDLRKHRILVVCSGRFDGDVFGASGAITVTTNPEIVADFITKPGPFVVISTYQSSRDVVRQAAELAGARQAFTFVLGISDEAHRTATHDKSDFSAFLHDDAVLAIKKRLFFNSDTEDRH